MVKYSTPRPTKSSIFFILTAIPTNGMVLGLTNGGFRVKEQTNVILRNLYLHDPPESKDLVELQYSTYVWIDHCDFSTEGLTGDKDYYDGLLDITHVRLRCLPTLDMYLGSGFHGVGLN